MSTISFRVKRTTRCRLSSIVRRLLPTHRFLICLLLIAHCQFATAQSQEAQQLLLNVEKLAQFKKILQNMYDGWKLVSKGYSTIRDLSSGNFQLHKTFLDALMDVSPAVKKYKRVQDIIHYQTAIIKQYKAAFQQFKRDDSFTVQELEHIGKVYGNLFNESVRNLDELLMIVTAGELRMNDEERLRAIDHVYERVLGQFNFLRSFNNSTSLLSLQRKLERADIEVSKKLHN